MRIQANPTALSSYGLNLEDLRTAIAQANVNQAKGNFDGPHQAFTIGANDQLLSSDEYRPLIIAYRNGAPVQLSDVATVIDDVGKRQAGGVDEQDAGGHCEHPAPAGREHHRGRRSDQRPCCRSCRSSLPVIRAAVDSYRPHRRPFALRSSDVQFELMLTVALVVMVIFLFLRTLSPPSFRASPCRFRWSAPSA